MKNKILIHKNPYFPYNKFIVRTPMFSIKDNFEQLLVSSEFWEALYLASPALHNECQHKDFIQDNAKLKSLYKYYIRSIHRCTPFGLFAGCSVGRLTDQTNIVLENREHYKRIIRLDMHFLCSLVSKIEKNHLIRNQLKYKSNTSIYTISHEIRYIEYYYQGASRVHNLVSIERNPYLDKVLSITQKYISFDEIVSSIVDPDIDSEEAREFIESLIDSQVLRSELDVHVTGKDILNVLIDRLIKLNNTELIVSSLRKISQLLSAINSMQIGTSNELYAEIIDEIKNLDVPFEDKFLFQTDLFKPIIRAEIDIKLANDIKELLSFLNRITPQNGIKEFLTDFKNKFYSRYEDEEIPLVEALDPDFGIGYGNSNTDLDSNLLIKDVKFPLVNNYKRKEQDLSYHYAHMMQKNNNKKSYEFVLDESLVSNIDDDWTLSFESLTVSISLFKDDVGTDLIILNGVWFGATNILGRFCHLDGEINQIVKDIADMEERNDVDVIYAAIVHLPDSRIGNIAFRPNTIRKYEIPYLANSLLKEEYQIPISDLLVSVKNDQIVLRSKRYQKEVIPKLDNAHNYRNNSTPIYNFLCDMQKMPEINYLEFQNNKFLSFFDFSPRIRYKNFILKKAQWRIELSDIKAKKIENTNDFTNYCETRNIPRFVSFSEGDNILYIDCRSEHSVRILLALIKKYKIIKIEESFNHLNNFIVKDMSDYLYNNEVLIPFIKNNNL